MTSIQRVSCNNMFDLKNEWKYINNISNYGEVIKVWKCNQKYFFLFWRDFEFIVLGKDSNGFICINEKEKTFTTIEGIPDSLKKRSIQIIKSFFKDSYVKIINLEKGYKVYVYHQGVGGMLKGVGGMLRHRKLNNKENFINDLMKSKEEIFNSFEKFLYFHNKLKTFYNKEKEPDFDTPEFESLYLQITNLVNTPPLSNYEDIIAGVKSNIKDALTEVLINVNTGKSIFWGKLSKLFLFTTYVWDFQKKMEERKEKQSNEEEKIILELESQIKQNIPIHYYIRSCTQHLDRLGHRYDFVNNPGIFDETCEMFIKVSRRIKFVFNEILLFEGKIESAKEDLKNTKNLCDLEEKAKTYNQLCESYDDVKQDVYKIRSELGELKDRIRITISQTLQEKKAAWKISIKNASFLTYVVQPSFWEKLSFLFIILIKYWKLNKTFIYMKKNWT